MIKCSIILFRGTLIYFINIIIDKMEACQVLFEFHKR